VCTRQFEKGEIKRDRSKSQWLAPKNQTAANKKKKKKKGTKSFVIPGKTDERDDQVVKNTHTQCWSMDISTLNWRYFYSFSISFSFCILKRAEPKMKILPFSKKKKPNKKGVIVFGDIFFYDLVKPTRSSSSGVDIIIKSSKKLKLPYTTVHSTAYWVKITF
jgi:hypothetical protein